MPLKYWDEAFLAATYLINRLPTKVLDFCSPLERLFQEKPNYGGLHTFGCTCWPNLRPFNMHMLQFHSKQCIFLGYNTLHKGFKCLIVAEGRVYVSQNVVFNETIYPFHMLNPNVGARPRGEIQLFPSNSTSTPSSAPGDELIVDLAANMPVIPVPTNASCPLVHVEKNPRENPTGN
jgi:hypothetical protein